MWLWSRYSDLRSEKEELERRTEGLDVKSNNETQYSRLELENTNNLWRTVSPAQTSQWQAVITHPKLATGPSPAREPGSEILSVQSVMAAWPKYRNAATSSVSPPAGGAGRLQKQERWVTLLLWGVTQLVFVARDWLADNFCSTLSLCHRSLGDIWWDKNSMQWNRNNLCKKFN